MSVLSSDSPGIRGTERPVRSTGFHISGVSIVHKHNNVNAFGTKQSVCNIMHRWPLFRCAHRAEFHCLCM